MREGGSKGFRDWIVVAVVVMEEGSMTVEGRVRVRGSSRFETDFADEGREEVFGVLAMGSVGVEDIGCGRREEGRGFLGGVS